MSEKSFHHHSPASDAYHMLLASSMPTFLSVSNSISIKLFPQDPCYTHEQTTNICACYVNNLFHCPNQPPPLLAPTPPPSLTHFITYTLHHTRLTSSVTFAALCPFQRLKTRFITACDSSRHRLFISAFMITPKLPLYTTINLLATSIY